MKYILLLNALFSLTLLYSQDGKIINTGTSASNMYQGNKTSLGANNGVWIKNSTVQNDLDGSYYLFNNWNNKAAIYDLNNKGYKLLNCNFNIETNAVEAQLDDVKNEIFAFNSRDILKVELGNKVFLNKTVDNGIRQLLEVVHEGEQMSIYKGYESSISEATTNPMTLQKMGNDRIVIKTKYYIDNNSKMEEVKLKKSTLLSFMADKKNDVKSFIKENKLSVSKDEDIKEIFQYYNTL